MRVGAGVRAGGGRDGDGSAGRARPERVPRATAFATYSGNHKLLRAGLVTTDSAAAGNEFGVAAVSALAGMFSKQAGDELEEVFDRVLASHEDAARADELR